MGEAGRARGNEQMGLRDQLRNGDLGRLRLPSHCVGRLTIQCSSQELDCDAVGTRLLWSEFAIASARVPRHGGVINLIARVCYTWPMDVVDRPPPPASSRKLPAADRTTKRWALVAALLCPCHLWLIAGLLGFFGASATADAIRDNQLGLVLVLAPLTAVALWKAVSAGRAAAGITRHGDACSPAQR